MSKITSKAVHVKDNKQGSTCQDNVVYFCPFFLLLRNAQVNFVEKLQMKINKIMDILFRLDQTKLLKVPL